MERRSPVQGNELWEDEVYLLGYDSNFKNYIRLEDPLWTPASSLFWLGVACLCLPVLLPTDVTCWFPPERLHLALDPSCDSQSWESGQVAGTSPEKPLLWLTNDCLASGKGECRSQASPRRVITIQREDSELSEASPPPPWGYLFVPYTRLHLCIQWQNLELLRVFRSPVSICCGQGPFVPQPCWGPARQPAGTSWLSQTLKGLAHRLCCSQVFLVTDTPQAVEGAERASWARCAVTESASLPGVATLPSASDQLTSYSTCLLSPC